MELNVGDIVRLKSGGPKMTVNRLDAGGYPMGIRMIECSWFGAELYQDGTIEWGDYHCADFASDALTLVERAQVVAQAA